jgi:hypothetical protein
MLAAVVEQTMQLTLFGGTLTTIFWISGAIGAARRRSKLATLRQEMVAAHPDRGGDTIRFIAARQRYFQARADIG